MTPAPNPVGSAPESRCSVLVVEDDPDIRNAIASLLEDDGYHATTRCDGAQALDWVKGAAHKPCLVLLDLRMPVMDGADFLKELRATPTLRNLRVCVLSADASPAPPGADYVLQKPVAASSLLRVVARLCCRVHIPGRPPRELTPAAGATIVTGSSAAR